MKNFEQPYLSRNITEFWRRWHISLSSWLKDYLYIPLGGNRKGQTRLYINLMLTMLLGGLWHGASWNFVIWGGLHGIYLAIHKIFLADSKHSYSNFSFRNTRMIPAYISKVLLTYLLILITWLFFRSSSWESTQIILSKFFTWESCNFDAQIILIAIIYLACSFLLDIFEYVTNNHTYPLIIMKKSAMYGLLAGLFIITLLYMFQSEPLPFVYFQF